jgi:hypothetical protein
VFGIVNKFDKSNIILGGDFNLVLDINKDKSGGRPVTHTQSVKTIKSWIDELDLADVWRNKNLEKREFTWRTVYHDVIKCRLDFYLVSFGLLSKVTTSKIISGYRSDHSAIVLNISLINNARGPGSVDSVKNVITEAANNSEGFNARDRWDYIKFEIKQFSMRYSSDRKKTAG